MQPTQNSAGSIRQSMAGTASSASLQEKPKAINCPLLESLLAQKGLALNGTYTVGDVADMFGVSVRTIQDRVISGELQARDLPGHARFLSEDLEDFLRNSVRNRTRKDRTK